MTHRGFLLVVLGMAMTTPSPATDAAPPTYTYCSSCADCSTKLASGSWTLVILSADIIDHVGTCVTLVAGESDVKFDCAGHTIDGAGYDIDPEYGIHMVGGTGNEIANCTISGFTTGIQLAGTTGHTVVNNTLVSNTSDGIELFGSSTADVHDNVSLGNTVGIDFYNSDNNTATANRACFNSNRDFNLVSSSGNIGMGNVCDIPGGWNDVKITGCSRTCSPFSDGFESGGTTRWSLSIP